MDIQTIITIIIGVVILGFSIYLIITKQWAKLREFAYQLMLSAEKVYDVNQGKEKFEVVFNVLYGYIPTWLTGILTQEKIKAQLQIWYNNAKDWLDDGQINDSI
jgi:undecaprenyl pyrophosphate phosphatase UppP